MSFVIYHKETTVYFTKTRFDRVQDAKAALTKAKNQKGLNVDDYAIADYQDFYNNIEKSVTKIALLSNKEIQVRANTPIYCDPSCESYYTM